MAIKALARFDWRMTVRRIARAVNFSVARNAQLRRTCKQEILVAALMRVVALGALSVCDRLMHRDRCLNGIGYVRVTFSTSGGNRVIQHAFVIGRVRRVTIKT